MKINKNGRLKNHRERNRTPHAKGKIETALDSVSEDSDVETRDQDVEAGQAQRGENVKETRSDVTARTLRSPRPGSLSLVAMKNHAHPEPAGKDRGDAGN